MRLAFTKCLTLLAGNHPYSRPSSNSDSGHAGSDLSSIAPSQSASQLNGEASHTNPSPPPKPALHAPEYRLRIAPAHSIDDHSVPNGRANGAPRASWRISEVPEPDEEEGGGSSADEDETGLEVHENKRFSKGKFKAKEGSADDKPFSIRPSIPASTSLPPPSPSTEDGSILGKRERHRSGSAGLFGRAIGALFHHRESSKEKERSASVSPGKASPGKAGGWRTRTDSNLAKVWRSKAGDDSSDDEGQTKQLYSTWSPNTAIPPKLAPVTLGASASTSTVHTTGKGSPTGQKLKKAKRSSVQTPPRNAQAKEAAQKGYESDSAGVRTTSFRLGRSSSVSSPKSGNTPTSDGKGKGKAPVNGDATPSPMSAKPQRLTELALAKMNDGSLSRNSSLSKQSMTSAASAPARTPARSATTPAVPHSASATIARSRTVSLQPAEPTSPAIPSSSTSPAGSSVSAPVSRHRRTASTSSAMPHRSGLTRNGDGPSLMSIVEGVAKQNKEAWAAQDPNRKLIDVRAPPPVNIDAALQDASKSAAPPKPTPNGDHNSDVPTKRSSPLLHHAKMPASVSAPALPSSGSTLSAKPPPKLPLRSALRNSSRTPSPNPPPAVRGSGSTQSDSSRDVSPARAMGASHAPATSSKLATVDLDDDATSISSYATGRESWDEDTPVAARTPQLSPSPSPQPPPKHDGLGSDVSGSSTTTEGAPTRRKSVRMSLPPTFSATPPAIEDDTDEETRGRHAPWGPSGQWSTRIHSAPESDVWQDSSEEDEDYSTARKLLSRISKRT